MDTSLVSSDVSKRIEARNKRRETILKTIIRNSKPITINKINYYGITFSDLWRLKEIENSGMSKPTFVSELRAMEKMGFIARIKPNKRDHIFQISEVNKKLEDDFKLFDRYLNVVSLYLIRKDKSLRTENQRINYLISGEIGNVFDKAWLLVKKYLDSNSEYSLEFQNPEFRKYVLSRFLEIYEKYFFREEYYKNYFYSILMKSHSITKIKMKEFNKRKEEFSETPRIIWKNEIEDLIKSYSQKRDLHPKRSGPSGI